MNHCSYFIKNKCLFGSYPTQISVNELEINDIKYFVNLTYDTETKIIPYTTKYFKTNFPIPDRSTPTDIFSFCKFIIQLSGIIRETKENEKFYIHCKGGQSRSPMVSSALLCYLFHISPHEALIYTGKCHKNRSILKEKWKKIGIPMTYMQKKFLYKLFHPINFNKIYKSTSKSFTFLSLPVEIYNFGKFGSVSDAFNKIKEEFENNNLNSFFQKFISKEKKNWSDIKDHIIEELIFLSIDQNEDIKKNLIYSYLRPIVVQIHKDNFWGIGANNEGKNRLGIILTKIRRNYLLNNSEYNLNFYYNNNN
jgi:protein-tyrosine phosphatase